MNQRVSHDIQGMSDAERVVRVANRLEISEYEVFRRAHLEWHGREADARGLDQVFARYLYFGGVPPWVRHHTRTWLRNHPESRPSAPRSLVARAALARLVDNRLVRYLLS